MSYRFGSRWSSSARLFAILSLVTAIPAGVEAREWRIRVGGGAVTSMPSFGEHLGHSIDAGVSVPMSRFVQGSVGASVENLAPFGEGSSIPEIHPVTGRTTVLSAMAGLEFLPAGRNHPGPVLSGSLGWAQVRRGEVEIRTDFVPGTQTYRPPYENALAGEIGAGVNMPIRGCAVRLDFHAADIHQSQNATALEARFRTRLRLEF